MDSTFEIFKHLDFKTARHLCHVDRYFRSVCNDNSFKTLVLPYLFYNSVNNNVKDAFEKIFRVTPHHNYYKYLYLQEKGILEMFNSISRLPYGRKRLYRALVTFLIIEKVLKNHEFSNKPERFLVYHELSKIVKSKIFDVIGEIILVFHNGYIYKAFETLKDNNRVKFHENEYAFLTLEPNTLSLFLKNPIKYVEINKETYLEPYTEDDDDYKYKLKSEYSIGAPNNMWARHLGMFEINESAVYLVDAGVLFEDIIDPVLDFSKESRTDNSLEIPPSKDEIQNKVQKIKAEREKEMHSETMSDIDESDDVSETMSDIEDDTNDDDESEDDNDHDDILADNGQEDEGEWEEEEDPNEPQDPIERSRYRRRLQYERFINEIKQRTDNTKKDQILNVVNEIKDLLK
jgi:hypothetical protein